LKWESLYHVENGEGDDNGQVRDQDSQDHEIEATLGPLGSLVGRPAAVDGGTSSLCDLSKADVSENFDVLVGVKLGFIPIKVGNERYLHIQTSPAQRRQGLSRRRPCKATRAKQPNYIQPE
jgi:hypothetical protein